MSGERWADQDLFQPGIPAWRIEFEFHTGLFREFRIATANQGLLNVAQMWAYATDDWLTFRDMGEDSNKSRWPISAEWSQIQNASLRGNAVPLERIRESEQVTSVEKLIPPFHGYLTSIGSRLGATDLNSCFEVAFDVVSKAEADGRISTLEKLAYKKRSFAT